MLTNAKEYLIAKFKARWPYETPHYKSVKRVDNKLFEAIMEQFGGYRAFLRRIGRPMPKTNAREEAFIRYSSMVSRWYHVNKWSSLEEYAWAVLEYLDLNNTFIHNFPFPSPKGSYYKLDFFNPWLKARIAIDGVFHQALPRQARLDEAKDAYLEQFGIKTLHLTGRDLHEADLVSTIVRFVLERQNQPGKIPSES